MNHTWKLSNHLFSWIMWKKGMIVLLGSLGLGLIFMLFRTFSIGIDAGHITHFPTAFLPYEDVVDGSYVMTVFSLGLLLLLILIGRQISQFFHNGKGMYTIFMLPMKRSQIYVSFLLSAAAVVVLYFVAWLMLMIVLYFPIMSHYAKVAAKEVFYVSPELTVQGLDAARSNGLFLAFRRSMFLSIFFPTSLWQFFIFLCGMLLVLVSVLYYGFHIGGKGGIVLTILGCYWGFNVTCIPYTAKDLISVTSIGPAMIATGVAILGLLFLTIISLRSMKKSMRE